MIKSIILPFLIVAIGQGVFGQSKPKKEIKTDDCPLCLITSSTGTLSTMSGYYRPDTVLAYFNEITGVENGKLITQWVRGFKVVKESYGNVYFINPGTDFFYSDKSKVTNKVIQSY